MADETQRMIHTLRTKSLRIAELEHELQTVRTYLGIVAHDADTMKVTPVFCGQSPLEIIAHADKVLEGAGDDNNVTPIRG